MKKGQRLFTDMIMIAILIIGICLFLYPFVSDALNQYVEQQVISSYQKKANEKNAEEVQAEKERLKRKNQEIAAKNNPGRDHLNEMPKKVVAKDKTYFEKHTIATLKIPKIKVSLPIYDQTNEIFLSRGATLLEGTSYPTGGTSTHTVLSAHRGLPKAKLFTDLPQLKKTDQFYIEINKETLAYEVDQVKTIEPTETEALRIVEGQDYVTLMTCTPYMINSHRLLVRGHRIPYKEPMKQKITSADRGVKLQQIAVLLGCLLAVGLIAGLIYQRVKAARIAQRKYDLHFYLQGVEGQPLARETFQLYSKNGKRPLTQNGEELYVTTNETGEILKEQLRGGSYKLKNKNLQLNIFVKKVSDKEFQVKKSKIIQLVTEKDQQVVRKNE
ncbi:class C sortase [Enterococcus pseudoavium]|uniref:Class C sortase n=1 Tax=Enterococcus pseudoavium TaxID=44007 RepID=A0ABU3FI90_9ENTE|nr:class C sortase [Enterococcus pseudoavium]MDT2770748.1 class C sortase [Enterococcus pseudoavium]